MDNTVLVTGAGGFIGSAVVRRLVTGLNQGIAPRFADGSKVEHVVALLRQGGSEERLQELTPSSLWSVKHADICNREELVKTLKQLRPRVIMHLAVDQQLFTDIPESEIQRLNDEPLQLMFECLAGVPDSRLIHTSSVWVLKSGMSLAEDAVVDPLSAYARAKFRLDELLPVLQKKTGVDWINLRLFNVYGKYESRSRLLPYLVAQLSQGEVASLSHGDQIRDFNDVDDIAEAYVLALQANESACGQIYHIGSGKGFSVREFAGIVAEVTGNAELIQFGGTASPDQQIPELVSSPVLARQRLAWSPPEQPSDRIQQAARWWLQHLDNTRS